MNVNTTSTPEATAEPRGHSHIPFWPAGSRHYGDTLGPLYRTPLTESIDLALKYIGSMPISENGVFTIGDYGANDGFSSMPFMHGVIEHLRRHYGEGLSIQIIYEDQEKSDFNSLFSRLLDSSSYMTKFQGVYPLATNLNFYRQCVPDGSCDVIFTSFAAHWLEKFEMNFKDSVFHMYGTEDEQNRFRAKAGWDWNKFLLLRAKELKPGGLLIAINVCANEQWKSDVLLGLEKAWKQMKEDKLITQEEYEQCTFQFAIRSKEEFESPFNTEGSAVRQAGLHLLYYDEKWMPCVYKEQWRLHQRKTAATEENRAVFADGVVSGHRVWSQSTFRGSLSQRRSEQEKDTILDHLYSSYHAIVMDTPPQSYVSEIYVSRLIARKMH